MKLHISLHLRIITPVCMAVMVLVSSASVYAGTRYAPPKSSLLNPQAQKTYPLVCRGGDVYWQFATNSNIWNVKISNEPHFYFTFKPAKFGIGQFMEKLAELQPGECTWMDRPLSSKEPNDVALLPPLVSGDVMIRRFAKGQMVFYGATVMHEITTNGSYVVFDVYNSGKGYMIATDYRTVSK